VIGEGQIGEVIEKDRIMEVEAAIALAPGIAGLLMRVDHQCRHVQALEPRRERQPVLSAADDQAIRLPVIA
jgi:hypothetical protein